MEISEITSALDSVFGKESVFKQLEDMTEKGGKEEDLEEEKKGGTS